MQIKSYSENKEYIKNTLKAATDPEVHSQQLAGTAASPVGSPDNPSDKLITVPNLITASRFVLVLVFMYLYISDHSRLAALICYIIAAISDFLDGFIARSTLSVSWVGKMMDPVIDRFLLLSGLIVLLIEHELPLWMVMLLVFRDLYLAFGSVVVRHFYKRPVDVVYVGKAATAALLIGFSDLLLGTPMVEGFALSSCSWLPGFNGLPCVAGIYFVYLGMICSAIATVIYTIRAIEIIRTHPVAVQTFRQKA